MISGTPSGVPHTFSPRAAPSRLGARGLSPWPCGFSPWPCGFALALRLLALALRLLALALRLLPLRLLALGPPFSPAARPSHLAPRAFSPAARPSHLAPRAFLPAARPSHLASRAFSPAARPSHLAPRAFSPGAPCLLTWGPRLLNWGPRLLALGPHLRPGPAPFRPGARTFALGPRLLALAMPSHPGPAFSRPGPTPSSVTALGAGRQRRRSPARRCGRSHAYSADAPISIAADNLAADRASPPSSAVPVLHAATVPIRPARSNTSATSEPTVDTAQAPPLDAPTATLMCAERRPAPAQRKSHSPPPNEPASSCRKTKPAPQPFDACPSV